MPLINCSACGNKISVEAEACPQCGHPNRLVARDPTEPKCYACSATATTRCQSCGTFSCARHLQSIFVSRNRGGGYELRCESCYSYAQIWQVIGAVLIVVILLIVVAVWFANAR